MTSLWLSLSDSHSRKPDLPVTDSSPFSTWLSILFFFAPQLKPRCQGRVIGFVGDGGYIAIVTPVSLIDCVLYCRYQILNGFSLSDFLCLTEAFNPGLRRPVPAVCRIQCGNVPGLAGNLSDRTVA